MGDFIDQLARAMARSEGLSRKDFMRLAGSVVVGLLAGQAPTAEAKKAKGCPAGQAQCGRGKKAPCIDVQADPKNCGGCGKACPAGQSCVGGACTPPTCPASQVCPDPGATNGCCPTNFTCFQGATCCLQGATCNTGSPGGTCCTTLDVANSGESINCIQGDTCCSATHVCQTTSGPVCCDPPGDPKTGLGPHAFPNTVCTDKGCCPPERACPPGGGQAASCCDPGQSCQNGICQGPGQGDCGPANCPTGCCRDGICRTGDTFSNCGKDGEPCALCEFTGSDPRTSGCFNHACGCGDKLPICPVGQACRIGTFGVFQLARCCPAGAKACGPGLDQPCCAPGTHCCCCPDFNCSTASCVPNGTPCPTGCAG